MWLDPIGLLRHCAAMVALGILIAALAVYGLFATLRRATSVNEVEAQHVSDAKMRAASEAIDEAAEHDPNAI